jgi:hypothetical protein
MGSGLLHRITLALCAITIGISVACGNSTPAATQRLQPSSVPAIHPSRVESPATAKTPSIDNAKTSDPNWPLLQAALDQALAQAGDQLAAVEWGNLHYILLSLSYDHDLSEIRLAAVEYLREGLREHLENVSAVSVADEIEDNLPSTDVEALYRLGRTFDVDAFLLVDIWALGIRPLEERLPSTPEFQAEASVAIHLLLFSVEEGYFVSIGDPIYETYQGNYVAHVPTKPTETPSHDSTLSLIAGEPYVLALQPRVTQEDIVWSPDSQSLLFSSGLVEEVDNYPQFVGNLFLSNLDGQAYQLTWLSAFESPRIYTFMSDDMRYATDYRSRWVRCARP